MFCRKLVSTIKIFFATDLLWSKCGNLLWKPLQWIIILCKNPCASTGNELFEIQRLLQHANENVNTNHLSARIIIHIKSYWLKLSYSDRKECFTEFTIMTWLHLSNLPLGHLPPPCLTCSPVSRSQSAGWSWGRCAGRAPALWWSSDSSGEGGTPVDIQGRWCNPPRWHLKHLRTPLWHRQKQKGGYWLETRQNKETIQ